MTDWLIEDIGRALAHLADSERIRGRLSTNLAQELALAFREGLDDVESFLALRGVVAAPDVGVGTALAKMAAKTMAAEKTRDELARRTVSIDSLGGYPAFEADVTRHALVAGVLQRRFSRHLDELGAPGDIRFDPYRRELEMRNHIFEAELLGSYADTTWLWAWSNPYLELTNSMCAASRRMRDDYDAPFCAAHCVDFGAADRMTVQHRIAGVASGIGLVGAYYIANESQVYGILPGQLPAEGTAADLSFALNQALIDGVGNRRDVIEYSAERLGLAIERTASELRAADKTSALRVAFDAAGRIAQIDSDLG